MSGDEDVHDDLFVHDDSYDPDKAGFYFDAVYMASVYYQTSQ